jgi:hypothetical protein
MRTGSTCSWCHHFGELSSGFSSWNSGIPATLQPNATRALQRLTSAQGDSDYTFIATLLTVRTEWEHSKLFSRRKKVNFFF